MFLEAVKVIGKMSVSTFFKTLFLKKDTSTLCTPNLFYTLENTKIKFSTYVKVNKIYIIKFSCFNILNETFFALLDAYLHAVKTL